MATANAQLIYAGNTDKGKVRDHNEDSYGTPLRLRVPAERVASLGTLLVVADGMGGRAAGEEASRMVIQQLFDRYYADERADRCAALAAALAEANAAIHAAGEADLARAGMASTVVALVLKDSQAFTAHAGDSRIYRWRGGQPLEQLTEDHTWVGENVKAGVLTKAEAANHPYRHAITRALGLEATVAPDISDWFAVQPGDRFLLCSDGLTNEVDDARLAQGLSTGAPQPIVDAFIAQARKAGGRDNITAIVAVINGGDGSAASGSAAKAAAAAGRRQGCGLSLMMGLLAVGIVSVAAVLVGMSVLKGGREVSTPTPTRKILVAAAPPHTPTLTPLPTSTIAPTMPKPTETLTRTPRPTATASFTPTTTPSRTATLSSSPTATFPAVPSATWIAVANASAWDKLARYEIKLTGKGAQDWAVGRANVLNQICTGFSLGQGVCRIDRSHFWIYLVGTLSLENESAASYRFQPQQPLDPRFGSPSPLRLPSLDPVPVGPVGILWQGTGSGWEPRFILAEIGASRKCLFGCDSVPTLPALVWLTTSLSNRELRAEPSTRFPFFLAPASVIRLYAVQYRLDLSNKTLAFVPEDIAFQLEKDSYKPR